MNPRVALLYVALDMIRWIMTQAQRVEAKMVHWKTDLIAKIHGEQSTYGW